TRLATNRPATARRTNQAGSWRMLMKTTPRHQAMFAFASLMFWLAGGALARSAPTVGRTVQPAPIDALFKAAIDGDVARVRSLLNQGADVNVRNRAGET